MSDPDLLPPSIDPDIRKIGIRKLTAHNAASTRTVIKVLDMEAEGEVDPRGSRGVAGVRPYFLAVRLKIVLTLPERVDQ